MPATATFGPNDFHSPRSTSAGTAGPDPPAATPGPGAGRDRGLRRLGTGGCAGCGTSVIPQPYETATRTASAVRGTATPSRPRRPARVGGRWQRGRMDRSDVWRGSCSGLRWAGSAVGPWPPPAPRPGARRRGRGSACHGPHDAERSAWARREAELTADRTADRERQAEQFRALAADALALSSEQFLALAHQRLAAAQQTHESGLREREEAVRALVGPLATTLQAVQRGLGSAEVARAEGAAALTEQVRAMRESAEHLRGETARLVTALRSPHVRGRWGELQLRRVVEAAGMLAHVDFVEQG